MIHRDDLRYTDDVIATLQSGNPLWYIANALDIDVKDVQYHYGEVFDLNHNGKVLPLRYAPEPPNVQARTGGPKRQYRRSQIYPRDPQYYAERTITQIANELGLNTQAVRNYTYRNGLKTKRAIMGSRSRTQWPTNPAWYAIRSASEIAEEFKLQETTVRQHAYKHKFKLRKSYRFVEWPVDPQWFAQYTSLQVAKILKTNPETVRCHCRKHGIALKPHRTIIDWPKDPAWYAERTRKEIAEELDVKYCAVAQHVWQYDIICKKDPNQSERPLDTV